MKCVLVLVFVLQVVFSTEDDRCVCGFIADSGLCEAYFPKFYYNVATNACEKFVYGGCGGNMNRFDTEESCESKCGDFSKDITPSTCKDEFAKDSCHVQNPVAEGGACPKCAGCMDYYYTNTISGCVKKGVCVHRTPLTPIDKVNRFATLEACERLCPKIG